MKRGNVWRRALVYCFVLLVAAALLLSGCGGKAGSTGGTPAGGSGGSPGGDAGGSSEPSTGQGKTEPGGDGGSPGDKGGADNDLADFDWDLLGLGLATTYAITSPFNKLGYTLHVDDAENPREWAVTFEWLSPGELAGSQAERLQLVMESDGDIFNLNFEYWFVDGVLAAFRPHDDDGPMELETDPAILPMMELSSALPLMPFHSAKMVTEGVDPDLGFEVKVVNQTVSAETLLGHRVPVATVSVVVSGPGGEQGEATLRIAQLGGLPFVLESKNHGDIKGSATITPTVIELR